jgi:drug/metabolite transporter (DMT)-like permease
MVAVLLAALAGLALGALAVAVRWGLQRHADPATGALVAALAGATVSAAVAAAGGARDVDIGELWPFAVAGLVAPGASQILLTRAVGLAGPSRAAIMMGTAPLISILIAVTLLDEPVRAPLVVGALFVVTGGVSLAGESQRPEHYRRAGAVLALLCAALFAARDNIVRWAARGQHPPPLVAATTTLLSAALFIAVYLLATRRGRAGAGLLHAAIPFLPAGLALAVGYDALVSAFDRGRVSVVSPLTATGSLWAVLLAAVTIGHSERIRRRTLLAALLIVAGGGLIGAIH